jgi:hypothetical protein
MANSGGNNTGSISNTGYNSDNTVSSRVRNSVDVENNNNICVSNDNEQTASSGDARVSENTTGGSATSGDASNTNSTTVSFNVTN